MQDIKSGGTRLATAEELLDMQEKADFFIAVGQEGRAISMLEEQLGEALGTSPYVWLDLLDLCRRLDRPADYERIRARFQKKFSAHLPDFEASHPESEGLVRYPRVLSRIQLLWPSAKVLKEIEAQLFEQPAPGSVTFDLEASRDLLLLYSVVLEVLTGVAPEDEYEATARAPLREASATSTEPVPLSVLGALDEEDAGTPSQDFDIDFSLDFASPRPRRQEHA
jgi:hypothetical protein